MNSRMKQLREALGISQESFGEKIRVKRSHISSLENGTRNITERIISDICREFNVNENWLRNGKGDMFVELDDVPLDEFIKKHNLTSLEYDIIKAFISMDPDVRHFIIDNFKDIFKKHENIPESPDNITATIEPKTEESEYRASWNGFLTEEEEVALVRRRHEDNKRSFRSSLISEKLKRTNA